jgi:predicted HTH transcriptional regulator
MSELFDLSNFDEYKEYNCREVKKTEGGLPVALWEAYSSFANSNGGVIILGVGERQDGTWYTTGLKNTDKYMKELQEKHILIREGTNRSGRWVIVRKKSNNFEV